MHLVTLTYKPPGIWVNNHPVIVPFLDAVLADSLVAFDLAEEWSTDVAFLDKSREFDYLVYLPASALPAVKLAALQVRL
jgi:hypothetical protein